MKPLYYITILFSMSLFPLFSAEIPSARTTFILREGTIQTEGLPGFPANRIPALFGRYETEEKVSVSVWAVREPLVFSPNIWVVKKTGSVSAMYSAAEPNSFVWIVQRTLPMRQELKDYSKWFFVFSFDRTVTESASNAFLSEYIKKTEFFFTSAKRLADISFPASLMINGF